MVRKVRGIAMYSRRQRNIGEGRKAGVVVVHGQHGEAMCAGQGIFGVGEAGEP